MKTVLALNTRVSQMVNGHNVYLNHLPLQPHHNSHNPRLGKVAFVALENDIKDLIAWIQITKLLTSSKNLLMIILISKLNIFCSIQTHIICHFLIFYKIMRRKNIWWRIMYASLSYGLSYVIMEWLGIVWYGLWLGSEKQNFKGKKFQIIIKVDFSTVYVLCTIFHACGGVYLNSSRWILIKTGCKWS